MYKSLKHETYRRPSDPTKISFLGFVFVGIIWTALWMLSIVATYIITAQN